MAALRTGEGFADIVVTAVVSSTAVAPDAEDTWQRLLAGESGIRRIEREPVGAYTYPVHIGAELQENFGDHLTRIEMRRLAYMQQMSTVLGRRLWAAAGEPDVDTKRLTVSIGLALGSTEEIPSQHDLWRDKGLRAVSPLAVQMYMPNAPAAAVGLDRKAKGGIISSVMADASGAAAIGQAWRQLVLGEADIAIAGGVETKIEAVPVAAFSQLGILSTTEDPAGACRPFDKDRNGMVFGEGGALMLLETEEHAKARGAPILARLMSAAMTSDGYDFIEPDPSGEPEGDAIAHAVDLAGLTSGDIDHVNAHATGTVFGDLAEARGIRLALGDTDAAVYAPKSALGHSLGAAGAVEAVLTVQALRDGVVPATLNLQHLDPQIDIDVVAGEPRKGDYRYAVSNSFALGGYNIALVFGAP